MLSAAPRLHVQFPAPGNSHVPGSLTASTSRSGVACSPCRSAHHPAIKNCDGEKRSKAIRTLRKQAEHPPACTLLTPDSAAERNSC